MPSSKFNQRPVPRRRPAVCATRPKPPPQPPPPEAAGRVAAAPACLPPIDVLNPHTVTLCFGFIDLDPALPPEDQPQISALKLSDPCTETPRSWYASHLSPPWLLQATVHLKLTPGLLDATLRLSNNGWEEFIEWLDQPYDAAKPFDSRLLTRTAIPGMDKQWIRAMV